MSITNYFEENGVTIRGPGAVCAGCCKLPPNRRSTLVPMPTDGLHEEYGGSEGEIFMHLKCAKEKRDEYKRCFDEANKAIEEWERGH